MTIITIIGARPQFIKAAMLSHAITQRQALGVDIEEKILHTGQHYDYQMSDVFFNELHIPTPTWHLGCTLPPEQMAEQIVPILETNRPDLVVVYGDTNSTLAGALAAQQCHLPIAHIEAGLRSYNPQMVEERNRIQTDQLATWLFCPTNQAVNNLHEEGITQHVYHVGDIMYDAALMTPLLPKESLSLPAPSYALATIHRAENTDQIARLEQLLLAFSRLSIAIVWPMHPRTRNVIAQHSELQTILHHAPHIHVIDSVGYQQMASLEHYAQCILTDSGGVQKEAYFQRTPCITLRDETEWTETVKAQWNTLVGTDTNRIVDVVNHLPHPTQEITEYGDGHTAEHILDILCASYS